MLLAGDGTQHLTQGWGMPRGGWHFRGQGPATSVSAAPPCAPVSSALSSPHPRQPCHSWASPKRLMTSREGQGPGERGSRRKGARPTVHLPLWRNRWRQNVYTHTPRACSLCRRPLRLGSPPGRYADRAFLPHLCLPSSHARALAHGHARFRQKGEPGDPADTAHFPAGDTCPRAQTSLHRSSATMERPRTKDTRPPRTREVGTRTEGCGRRPGGEGSQDTYCRQHRGSSSPSKLGSGKGPANRVQGGEGRRGQRRDSGCRRRGWQTALLLSPMFSFRPLHRNNTNSTWKALCSLHGTVTGAIFNIMGPRKEKDAGFRGYVIDPQGLRAQATQPGPCARLLPRCGRDRRSPAFSATGTGQALHSGALDGENAIKPWKQPTA